MSLLKSFLMEQQKIMYATIKGTLTENDGVFSGFSSSNYLLGQTIITSEIQQQYIQSSEFKFKITLPNTISNEEHILYFPYKGSFNGFTLRTNGKIRWYVISSDISILSSSAFTLGSTIFIKGVISNNVATLYLSSDGVSWNNEGSVAITEIAPTVSGEQIKIGVGGSSPFGGSIDLPNSYIKLGSTKYKLQAVVGYTIVGSPTITDGIVSGFSSANYLQIAQNSLGRKAEIVIKFTTSNSFSTTMGLFSHGGNYIYIKTNRRIETQFNYGGSNRWVIGQTTLQNDTTYYLKFVTEYDKGVEIWLSTDGINYVLDGSNYNYWWGTLYVQYAIYGYIGSFSAFNGSIDLNETYTKVNNKLWFNGQQA